MKLLVISLLISLVFAKQDTLDEEREKMKKWTHECIQESGVTSEVLQQLRSEKKVDDPKLKEYTFCTFKKNGFMTEDGELQYDIIKSTLKKVSGSEEEANKVINDCVVKKSTPQETAYETVDCWYRYKRNL
ncbi:uncharacterized protein LOC123010318 isoform X1 [Tribolium madens]|uniref:uncharacterized protein LOC123010318 isoform X1 n=2 Tax=Tribolium madens TaxID=41895 RepID=UPI001CF72E85|nr:uncharacterized protein LOC123010318 isoform X1 [Tribolium madens]XP_044263057.1 uncharacterized protein LOC123010318 isoform X1 [Tribolium madens]